MPACFQLTKKGATEPTSLNAIDEEICNFLREPIHPKHYVIGWYDVIGFAIATGKPLGSKELRDYVADMPQETERLLQVLDFLEQHYTSDSWREIGRR